MNLYICSTTYHIYVSLCIHMASRKKGILYLTTNNKKTYKVFLELEKKILQIGLMDEVVIRHRGRLKEHLYIENIIDRNEYKKFKGKVENGTVYNFGWNPYTLFVSSNFLYKKLNNFIFVEDGANVYAFAKPTKRTLLLKKYLYGINSDFYKNEKVKKILVQYPEKYQSHLKNKLEHLNLNSLVSKLSDIEIQKIIQAFVTNDELKKLNALSTDNSIIFLTQPLSEDGFISEKEKITLYKKLVKEYGDGHKIIIKKHPRETTKYCFDNILEIDASFPSELFSLLGIKFSKAIGICTSAINTIDAKEKFNVDEKFLMNLKENKK
ncbi:alpha-2,8-polysialyltransferase family protein [Bacillus carboniphilus]|uniref:Alpha-2,8-polysialyltransferase family protein n=1 Tax=Bacillus carboniphilus TaxID=86663 RepID=A0ABY9JQA8_9BACI|nr:alpha-2,8-polysialyltransferase family protein [Bacillus carboniphilus]WLR41586.1 alpha-2,8-polysialyltransferase family protein [Bacillus carboniphilus]